MIPGRSLLSPVRHVQPHTTNPTRAHASSDRRSPWILPQRFAQEPWRSTYAGCLPLRTQALAIRQKSFSLTVTLMTPGRSLLSPVPHVQLPLVPHWSLLVLFSHLHEAHTCRLFLLVSWPRTAVDMWNSHVCTRWLCDSKNKNHTRTYMVSCKRSIIKHHTKPHILGMLEGCKLAELDGNTFTYFDYILFGRYSQQTADGLSILRMKHVPSPKNAVTFGKKRAELRNVTAGI